ncbi:MAG: DNA-binding transcriptional ArsR family regulator [Candidatus Poriferisodalaceae bacterium]|jgi:DNA-binding transcriptional ArsR family regulator
MNRPIYEMKAEFFKTLGHPARIRVLEVLGEGPHSVSDLQPKVGIESSHLSQQLAVLRKAGVVKSERKGNLMIYSVVDPSIFDLLQVAKEMLTRSLFGAQELLADLETVEFSVDRKSL